MSCWIGAALLVLTCSAPAVAQDADEPPPGWTGSLSVGIALTSGNTDTSTFNAAYELEHDAGGRTTFKSTGLHIRGSKDGDLTVDKTALGVRADYRLVDGLSAFGQTNYLRDRFKEIENLIAPTVGLSYEVAKTERVEFSVDSSVGLVFEQNTGRLTRTDGAVAAGEKLELQVTETARVTHSVSSLWKVADFGDALYTLTAGIAASVTENSELKAELQDSYKTRPPTLGLVKNDVSILLSFVYKF
ncbi:MAG: YdiY family protein [Vicinamibacterales bacterium]